MSASTVPAAVPEPNSTPGTPASTTPATGLIASMLAPVEPARTTFSLDPQTSANGTTGAASGTPVEGASSASYHGAEDAQQSAANTTAGGGSGKAKQGIWRAWLLAGAARWARGGGTQNKRLDVKKARAMAHQVKETRQAAINKSGGLGGPGGGRSAGSSGSSATGPGGKSLDSKGGKGAQGDGAAKGPKNSPTGPGAGPGGRSGGAGSGSGASGGGRGSSGASPTGAKDGGTPKGKQDSAGRTPKTPKTPKGDTPSGPKGDAAGGAAGGKSGAPGSAGSPGKDSKGAAAPKDAAGKQPDGASAKGPAPKAGSGPDGTAGKGAAPAAGQDGKGIKHSLVKKTTKPGPDPVKADGEPKDGDKPKADQKTDQAADKGKPFTTKDSRETGYRDGSRAAKAVAHTKAYRDGLVDGWTDTIDAADREKARLDQAHQDRKDKRAKEQPVTGTASSADYHQPQPIEVVGVDDSHVYLGDGATKPFVTRGEVRTLKAFERRLEEKADVMTKVADDTKGLKAHAEEQAKKATRLMEVAKSVKGGDKLTGALTKLQDAAVTQSSKAEEIHKRAVRATEGCSSALTNVETRYGGIYQAVVDSDETIPAELAFYKG